MNVQGTALTTTREFVKTGFPGKFNEWLDSLPPESKNLYASTLDATKWYPLKEGYSIPVKKVIEQDTNHAILKIMRFDEIDMALEYHIAGWIKRALELANCKEPYYEFGRMLSKGDDFTEIKFGWS